MDISRLSGVLALWIGMVTNVIGPPPGSDRGYRWGEWQTCTTGCSSPNMRYRVCVKLNNGASFCSADETEESIDPNAPSPTDAPSTTTAPPTTVDTLTTAQPTTTSETTTTTTAEHLATTIETTTEEPTTEKQLTTITTDTTTPTSTETSIATTESTSSDINDAATTTDITENPTTALSTVYHSTTFESEQNTSCGCECKKAVWTLGELNLTTEEANALIAELRQQLAVNVSQLSSTIRKKTSAPDDRVSSAAMGYVSGGILAFIFCFIIGIDVFGLMIKLRR
ncbi:uncharacterized protein [Argopecten irradians]|uniref:uncharacterized protein n=1 Tax=Argopecten irradians TaxID=31199 RepID=UPI0037216292